VRRAEPAATLPDGVALRHAEPADRVAALRVIEGALLEVDAAAVSAAIDADRVVVAEREPGDDRGTRIVGALVLRPLDGDAPSPIPGDPLHVEAVAVARARRGDGVGAALVIDAARLAGAGGREAVTADYRPELRPFYADLGFEVVARDDRLWGRRRIGTRGP